MGKEFAKNVNIFDKVDDTKNQGKNSFGPLNDCLVIGVIYLVKYFHIFLQIPFPC